MGAVHNALRHGSALARGIGRAMGMRADDEGVARLGETLTPVFNPWDRPEHALPRGELLVWATDSEAAGGAGTRSKVQLEVPAGTNVIFTVDEVWLSLGANGTAVLALGAAQYANDDAGLAMRDMRGNQPRSQTTFRSETTAGIGTANQWLFVNVVATQSVRVPLGVVLSPGGARLSFFATADQVAITVAVLGRERTAFPGELRL